MKLCSNVICVGHISHSDGTCKGLKEGEKCSMFKPIIADKELMVVVHALKEQLDRLLSVVNAVTCPHRHGQPIRPKDLTRLTNRQIEVEEALRDMGYDS